MKTSLLTRLALLGGIVLLSNAASAQTWQTVDNFTYVHGAIPSGLALDPFGNVFAAGLGMVTNPSGLHAIVRLSGDAGATWQTADDFTTSSNNARYGNFGGVANGASIASDSAGNVYGVGGFLTDVPNWFTAQSTNSGATWNNVDTVPNAWAIGVAADYAGNAYVVGRTNLTLITRNSKGSVTNTYDNWLVRKGINGGSSWATVDTSVPANGNSVATAVLCHPTYGVFVTGVTNGFNFAGTWMTRRSLDGGATWTTVDKAGTGMGLGIGADALGNLYVVGATQVAGLDHWLVRKSSDGGNSWRTVDDYTPGCVTVTVTNSIHPFRTTTTTTCYLAVASAFAADSSGNLFVVGLQASANGGQWLVRENPGGKSSWRTVDTFQDVPGLGSSAYAIAADALGHVYVAGWAIAGDGSIGHWIVRKN